MTLRQFARRPESIPTASTWLLADLAEARGRQELYTKQSPQRLKALLATRPQDRVYWARSGRGVAEERVTPS